MALPPTVRVKLSSEAAESISITPVVVQEMPVRELVEYMLGVTGKDEARIGELLLRGSLVSGASRFRWQGWEVDRDAVRTLLATFPDPDPAREAAARKGRFQRASFWDIAMGIAGGGVMGYVSYSYRERCDRYLRELS